MEISRDSRSLASSDNYLQGLARKTLCSSCFQEEELGSWADVALQQTPACPRGHSQARGTAALLLQQGQLRARGSPEQAARGACLAWHSCGRDPAGSQAGWICLRQLGGHGQTTHTTRKEKQDKARMDAFKRRETGCSLRKMGVQRRDTGEINTFQWPPGTNGNPVAGLSLLLELEHLSLLPSRISPGAIASSSPLGGHSRLCGSSPLLTATAHRLHSKGEPSRVGAAQGAPGLRVLASCCSESSLCLCLTTALGSAIKVQLFLAKHAAPRPCFCPPKSSVHAEQRIPSAVTVIPVNKCHRKYGVMQTGNPQVHPDHGGSSEMGWGEGHRNLALRSLRPEFTPTTYFHPLTYYTSISLAKAICKSLEGRTEGKQVGPSCVCILGTSRVRVWRKDHSRETAGREL